MPSMTAWASALLLRLLHRPDSERRRWALGSVLRAADKGARVAAKAVARELEHGDEEAVWRAWLTLTRYRFSEDIEISDATGAVAMGDDIELGG